MSVQWYAKLAGISGGGHSHTICGSGSQRKMVGGWNVSLLIQVILVGSLVLRNCHETSLCSKPIITRLNFRYFVSVLNGTNRTLSCEIHSDTPLKGDPIWRREYHPALPPGHCIDISACSLSTRKTCILSNLTLIHVVQGYYEGNYTLTAENDCGNTTVYVNVNIIGKLTFTVPFRFLSDNFLLLKSHQVVKMITLSLLNC